MSKKWVEYDYETLVKEKTGVDIYEDSSKSIMQKLDEIGMEYDKKADKFIQVKCYSESEPEEIKKIEWYSCLITSNNKITIGEHIFWDWEDDCLK